MEHSYRHFVGIDGGWEDHKVLVTGGTGKRLEERVVRHRGDEIGRLADWLGTFADGEPAGIAVAIEVTHGAVVDALLEHGFHVYAINPKQLDRFRDRFSPAGAKDDRLDALVLASSLRTDLELFQRLEVSDPLTIALRETVRTDAELREEVGRLSNQLTAQIHRYFPQILEFGSLADQPWLWDLLEHAPTPQSARQLRHKTITAILKKRRIRRLTARQVADILKKKAVSLAPGTVEAIVTRVNYLLPRLRLAFEQRAECKKRMTTIMQELARPEADQSSEHEQRDVDIILSCPGLGTRVGATLLGEAQRAMSRRSYNLLRCYSGSAPITKQSGKHRGVYMRRACNSLVRDAVYHWATVSVQYDERSNELYQAIRARGHNHARAIRGVADRNLAVLCAMLRTGTRYNPELRKRSTTKTA